MDSHHRMPWPGLYTVQSTRCWVNRLRTRSFLHWSQGTGYRREGVEPGLSKGGIWTITAASTGNLVEMRVVRPTQMSWVRLSRLGPSSLCAKKLCREC